MQDSTTDSVSDLPPLEALLLWTIRAWVVGQCHARDAASGINKVFAQLGAPEAAQSLEAFMHALARGGRRSVEIHCTCTPNVSDDERALLRVLALEQEEAPDESCALLAGLITERDAAAASASAYRLVNALELAGQFFCATTLHGPDGSRRSGSVLALRHKGYLH